MSRMPMPRSCSCDSYSFESGQLRCILGGMSNARCSVRGVRVRSVRIFHHFTLSCSRKTHSKNSLEKINARIQTRLSRKLNSRFALEYRYTTNLFYQAAVHDGSSHLHVDLVSSVQTCEIDRGGEGDKNEGDHAYYGTQTNRTHCSVVVQLFRNLSVHCDQLHNRTLERVQTPILL